MRYRLELQNPDGATVFCQSGEIDEQGGWTIDLAGTAAEMGRPIGRIRIDWDHEDGNVIEKPVNSGHR